MKTKIPSVETEDARWHISHFKIEQTIDRLPVDVWPTFVDIRKWITDYKIEAIHWPLSTPIEVGAISKIIPLCAEAPRLSEEMYYVMDVYEVIPEREIVLWLTADYPHAFDLKDLSAFYHWKLREVRGQTLVTIEQFNSYKPLHVPVDDPRKGNPEDPESYHQYRSPSRSWIVNLQRLGALISSHNPSAR